MNWISYTQILSAKHFRPHVEILAIDPYDGKLTCKCTCLLDTGSDISALPVGVIKDLQLQATGILHDVLSYPGLTPTEQNEFSVCIRIFGRKLPAIQVLQTPKTVGVLGRDVLNHFFLKVDGPRMRFKEGRFL